jgi:murein DD-endopeptidase MepM/ murein hydrolase activator NlpD
MFDIATTRTFHAQPRGERQLRPWIWPLPRIGDREPIVRSTNSDQRPHALITYAGTTSAQGYLPVFAVHDGVITFAGKTTVTSGGATLVRYSMCLDHAGGWSTRYGDLEHMFSMPVDRFARRRKQRVRAGDILGYANRSPVSLAFELWRSDDEAHKPIDPAKHMRDWLVLPWHEAPITDEHALDRQAA